MASSTREVLIRILRGIPDSGFMYERAIPRAVSASRRKQIVKELSTLLGEGYVIRLGTGRRGDPHRIVLNVTWPFNKCPLCGHIEFPASTKTPESVVMG